MQERDAVAVCARRGLLRGELVALGRQLPPWLGPHARRGTPRGGGWALVAVGGGVGGRGSGAAVGLSDALNRYKARSTVSRTDGSELVAFPPTGLRPRRSNDLGATKGRIPRGFGLARRRPRPVTNPIIGRAGSRALASVPRRLARVRRLALARPPDAAGAAASPAGLHGEDAQVVAGLADQVERRLIGGENLPHSEKVFVAVRRRHSSVESGINHLCTTA